MIIDFIEKKTILEANALWKNKKNTEFESVGTDESKIKPKTTGKILIFHTPVKIESVKSKNSDYHLEY